MVPDLANSIVAECERRLLTESIPRLKKCLDLLNEGQVWHSPNPNTNSVGNLVLHLCGNARQWLLSGLGGIEDTRQRQREFDEQGPIAKAVLHQHIDELVRDIGEFLPRISEADLLATHAVQGFKESGVAILIHVTEHFSYHVGQATYIVKLLQDIDTGYYAGQDLDKKG